MLVWGTGGELLGHALALCHGIGKQHGLLGGEVPEERARADVGSLSDLVDRRPLKAALPEQLESCRHDRRTGPVGVALTKRHRRFHLAIVRHHCH